MDSCSIQIVWFKIRNVLIFSFCIFLLAPGKNPLLYWTPSSRSALAWFCIKIPLLSHHAITCIKSVIRHLFQKHLWLNLIDLNKVWFGSILALNQASGLSHVFRYRFYIYVNLILWFHNNIVFLNFRALLISKGRGMGTNFRG